MTVNRQRIPRNGKTIREIAEKTGFSTNTIVRWTSEPRADYLARADEKRVRVRELRALGLTIRSIAAETGRHLRLCILPMLTRIREHLK